MFRLEGKLAEVDAVANRSNVVEIRAAVGVADGNVISSTVVFLEHGQYLG